MKKIVVFALIAILLVECKKVHPNNSPNSVQASIFGNWELNKVTNYFYDAAGLRDSNALAFPIPPNNDRYGYQFNSDNTWEQLFLSNNPAVVSASGTFVTTSDSSFTLLYPAASPSRMNEPCKIILLTNSQFIFSKQLQTVFNGTDSGYIKRIFTLSR
jgi:hypothetical protein